MSGGPRDFTFITPEKAAEIDVNEPRRAVEHFRRLAKKNQTCDICDEPAWKYGETGMCFTCTTGEADASDDYELIG